MKNILFIGGLGNGGAENQITLLARAFRQKGHHVIFLCVDAQRFHMQRLKDAGIPVSITGVPKLLRVLKLRDFYIAYVIWKVAKREHIDASISFLLEHNLCNCLAAKYSSRKYKVITGIRNAYKKLFTSKLGLFCTYYQKYSDVIVSNSDAAKNLFLECYPKYKAKVTTIYNAVDMTDSESEYVCKKTGKLQVVIAASYRDVKNPYGLVKALFDMTLEERTKIVIHWYGSFNQYQKELERKVSELGLSGVLVMHDATHDIGNVMKQADVVALFSKLEGFPNAICEGMMLGKPIVMTRVSDYITMVDNSNGRLCSWDDAESIKYALLDIADMTEEELMELGRESKKKAEAMFTMNVIYEKWNSLIK